MDFGLIYVCGRNDDYQLMIDDDDDDDNVDGDDGATCRHVVLNNRLAGFKIGQLTATCTCSIVVEASGNVVLATGGGLRVRPLTSPSSPSTFRLCGVPRASEHEEEVKISSTNDKSSSSSSINVAPVTSVGRGERHLLVVDDDGRLLSAGDDENGKLGREGAASEFNRVHFSTKRRVICAAGGNNHSIVCNDAGECYAFGRSSEGQLGVDLREDYVEPRLVAGLGSVLVTQVAAGHSFCLLKDIGGRVFAFGDNAHGELGRLGGGAGCAIVDALADVVVAEICTGLRHSIAITIDNDVYVWGNGDAFGLRNVRSVPKPVCLVVGAADVVAAAGGWSHTLFLTSSGFVYSVGNNNYSQLALADADQEYAEEPTAVALPAPAHRCAQVAAGAFFSLFLPDAITTGLARDMRRLINDERSSDIILLLESNVDDEDSNTSVAFAHSYLLRVRSPLFYRHILESKESKRDNNNNGKPRLIISKAIVKNIAQLNVVLEFLYTDFVYQRALHAVDAEDIIEFALRFRLDRLLKIGERALAGASIFIDSQTNKVIGTTSLPPSSLSDDLTSLLIDSAATSASLLVSIVDETTGSSNEFYVHPAIMAVRAPLLLSDLLQFSFACDDDADADADVDDGVLEIVRIESMSASTFHRLLTYVYADDLSHLQRHTAVEFLRLGLRFHMSDIAQLAISCLVDANQSHSIEDPMTVDEFLEVYALLQAHERVAFALLPFSIDKARRWLLECVERLSPEQRQEIKAKSAQIYTASIDAANRRAKQHAYRVGTMAASSSSSSSSSSSTASSLSTSAAALRRKLSSKIKKKFNK